MPTMASITVKKNDGTTDIVYDAVCASSGDQAAVWRQDTGNTSALPVGLRSKLTVSSSYNGPKTARVMRVRGTMPYATQDSTTGLYSAKDQVVVDATVTLPESIPAGQLAEVSQMMNLLASALLKSSFGTGYAPT